MGFLLEILRFIRERKPAIHFTDEPRILHTLDGCMQITNLFRIGNMINLPDILTGLNGGKSGNFLNIPAKIIRKKEIYSTF